MAEYTKYLRLIKPGGNDYYNIDDFNQNSELIDKETEKLNNAVTEIKNGATREKAGIVQYGTTEGKALEGMMLARMFGCVGYGGDIQDPGAKNVNYVYFDRNTRKMYKCLNQNSDVSANVANFIPLDNNSLLDRLENLSNFRSETITINSTNGILNQSFKLIAVGKIRIICFMNIFVKNDYETDYILPDWFLKNTEDVKASCANGTGGATGEVAEIHFEPSTKKLKFYPALRQGFSGNLQLSGQVISVAND
jgi:hypothetical protein